MLQAGSAAATLWKWLFIKRALYLQIIFRLLNPKYISDFSRILVEFNGLYTSFQNYWWIHEVRKTNYRQSLCLLTSFFLLLKIIAILMSDSHGWITSVKNLIKFSRWNWVYYNWVFLSFEMSESFKSQRSWSPCTQKSMKSTASLTKKQKNEMQDSREGNTESLAQTYKSSTWCK